MVFTVLFKAIKFILVGANAVSTITDIYKGGHDYRPYVTPVSVANTTFNDPKVPWYHCQKPILPMDEAFKNRAVPEAAPMTEKFVYFLYEGAKLYSDWRMNNPEYQQVDSFDEFLQKEQFMDTRTKFFFIPDNYYGYTFWEAHKACTERDAQLPTFVSMEEIQHLSQFLTAQGGDALVGKSFWTGLRKTSDGKDYIDVNTGIKASVTWFRDTMEGAVHGENCITYNALDDTFKDERCDNDFFVVCEQITGSSRFHRRRW